MAGSVVNYLCRAVEVTLCKAGRSVGARITSSVSCRHLYREHPAEVTLCKGSEVTLYRVRKVTRSPCCSASL